MEETNLIGLRNVEGRKHFYQALSFFYLDPFCIKTPKSKKKSIKVHFREYIDNLRKLRLDNFKLINKIENITGEDINSRILYRIAPDLKSIDASYLPFIYNGRDNSIIPAQKIFQGYSCDSNEFMKNVFYKNIDYKMLYELIKESFRQIHDLCRYRAAWIDYEMDYYELVENKEFKEAIVMKNEFMAEKCFPALNMLDYGKIAKILDISTLRLIDQYSVTDWFGRDITRLLSKLLGERYSRNNIQLIEKKCWKVLLDHMENVKKTIETQLRLYQQIQRQNTSLNDIMSAQIFDIEGL
jgi:hypothetical protein